MFILYKPIVLHKNLKRWQLILIQIKNQHHVAKLSTSAGLMWFVEGQGVTSAKGVGSLFEGLHPHRTFPDVHSQKKPRKRL